MSIVVTVLQTKANMAPRRTKQVKKNKNKSLIKTYGTFLEGLTHLPPKVRQKMIQESPKEVIDCVGECCLNLIKEEYI